MKAFSRLALLLLLLALLTQQATAFWTPFFSADRAARTRLDVEVLHDPTCRMTLDQAMKSTGWAPSGSSYDAPGALWLRTTIYNPDNDPREVLLESLYNQCVEISFYVPQAGGAWQEARAGQGVPIRQRTVQSTEPAALVALAPQEKKTIYVRLNDPFFATPVLYEWQPAQRFFTARFVQEWLMGIYFGAVIVLIVTNLFTWVGLRERVFLYYVGYVGCFAVFVFFCASLEQVFFPWLFTVPLGIQDHAAITLAWMFLLLFARDLLEMPARIPRTAQVVKWTALIWGAHAPLYFTPLAAHPWMLATHRMIVMVLLFGLFGIAVWQAFAGNRAARMFLFAYSLFFLIQVWLLLSLTNLFPSADVSAFHLSLIGISFEVIVLSVVLSGRVRLLREEREALREQAAGASERYAAQLEETVQDRTRELAEREKEKDALVSLLGHDLKGLIAVSVQAGRLLHKGKLSPEEQRDVSQDLVEANAQIQRMTAEVMEWARTRLDRTSALRETDLVALLRDAAAAHALAADARKIRLQTEFPAGSVIRSDPGVISAVVRNFISNAIRHSPFGGEIVFGFASEGAERRVFVRDRGNGIDGGLIRAIEEGNVSILRAASSSSGVGLMLCRELLASVGSRIECGNRVDGGAEFSFRLWTDGTRPADDSGRGTPA